MDVRIDQPRQDQVRPVVDHLRAVGWPRELSDVDNLPVLDLDRAVLEVAVAVVVVGRLRLLEETQHPPAEDGPGHGLLPSRYQATSRSRSSGVISVTLPGGMAWL